MKRSSRTKNQMSLQDPRLKSLKQFGGSLLKKSHAKSARPLSTKHAIHVVLKSSIAKGALSLRSLKNQRSVEKILRSEARKYGIKIYEFANVGNHLHLLIKLNNRFTYAPFIRALTGRIALVVSGANKNQNLKQALLKFDLVEKKFWDFRPWTRIVEWKKSYSVVKDYIIQNHLEAIGLLERQPERAKKHLSFHEAPT